MKDLGVPGATQRAKLKVLLDNESDSQMPMEVIDMVLDAGTIIELRPKEELIPVDSINTNIYIIYDGIIRCWSWFGDIEKTTVFGTEGTLVISHHCLNLGMPSPVTYEACCPTRLFKLTREAFNDLLDRSPEFVRWCLGNAYMQLAFFEKKNPVIQGSAAERYRSLAKNHPEIIANVSLKTISSYLGITPQYLSCIRRQKQ